MSPLSESIHTAASRNTQRFVKGTKQSQSTSQAKVPVAPTQKARAPSCSSEGASHTAIRKGKTRRPDQNGTPTLSLHSVQRVGKAAPRNSFRIAEMPSCPQ
jgi:hypothetical protein